MSQWKLVEAEPLNNGASSQQQKKQFQNNRKQQQGNNRRYQNNGRRNNRNRNRGDRRHNDIYIPDTPETRQQYATMAVQLLEYYFSDDSLSCDTFIRSYLDCEGYIPIAFVCNFPDVAALGAYYEDILSQLQSSEKFEIDMENETMRVSGWEKWLMPDGNGGFGVPRYIKNAEQPHGEVNSRSRAGSELSANASEYVSTNPENK